MGTTVGWLQAARNLCLSHRTAGRFPTRDWVAEPVPTDKVAAVRTAARIVPTFHGGAPTLGVLLAAVAIVAVIAWLYWRSHR
jgi:hypothetical protein